MDTEPPLSHATSPSSRDRPHWIGQLPLTHFLRIVRGILLKGAGIGSLWLEVAAILAFLAAALAARRPDVPEAAGVGSGA